MERFSSFKELKEKESLKLNKESDAKALEKEMIAFIELLKKSVVVDKSKEEI